MSGISKNKYLLAVAMVAFSSAALSKEISYDFIQGTYSSISITDSSLPDIDGNGFSVSGSFSVSPNLAINAGYEAASFDRVLGIDMDATALTFGITAHTAVAPGTDVFGSFSVLNADVEASDGFTTISDDDIGNIIGIGLRHMLSEAVELAIGVSRTDVFDDTSNTFGFGARFYANDTFSVGVGYSTGDDTDTILLNARVDI